MHYWIHGAVFKLLACLNPQVKFIFRVELAHMFYGHFKMLKLKSLHASGNQVFQKNVLQKPIYWRSIKLTSQV